MMSSKRRRRAVGQDDEPRPRRRKHLYLVLDDWNNGFSVHKIDPDAGAEQGHLTEPPVVRLESPMGGSSSDRVSVSALGTKIFVLMSHRCALVYDTETAAVSTGPHAPARMLCGSGVTVPAGGTLYALSHRFLDREDPHALHVMQQHQAEGWSCWKTLPEPPPALTIRQMVVSHALHPDGRTVFMTTADRGGPGEPLGTYSFDTERSEWRRHGDWGLPFFGQGFFDSDLDAWVGLHMEGYVCCCRVASRRSRQQQLDWQMTKEKLAYDYEDGDERPGTVSLTYTMATGGTTKFCIVETMMPDGVDDDDYYCLEEQLRFTTFGLKYDRSGELRITNRRSTSYLVPRHKPNLFVPCAFWI